MLTDAACRHASCPADKPRARFADAGGLYLEVAAAGSKRWFVKYRFGGKEKRLALGNYPAGEPQGSEGMQPLSFMAGLPARDGMPSYSRTAVAAVY